MDGAIFAIGLVLALAPLALLKAAIKEAKGGEPAKTVLRDENGHVIGSVDTVTPKRKLFEVPLGKWYLLVQILLGGFGLWMMIDSFS